jgi:hypothetical protein
VASGFVKSANEPDGYSYHSLDKLEGLGNALGAQRSFYTAMDI